MDRKTFTREAKEYAKQVPPSYPELEITPDHFEVEVTAKQTSVLGNARSGSGSPYQQARLGLSWHAYANRGYEWERLQDTIRHELCHIDNWFVHGHMGHGPTFVELAESLDCARLDRYDDCHDPRYQYVRDTDGVASWNHYDCKSLRYRRDDDNYTVFKSDEHDIRELSPDWRESSLTAGLRPTGGTPFETSGATGGVAADDE